MSSRSARTPSTRRSALETSTCSSGAGAWIPIPTSCCRPSPAPSASYEEDGEVYADLSDSFYCNPEYDELYAQQAVETDPAARADLVRQMQQILLDDAVYAVT